MKILNSCKVGDRDDDEDRQAVQRKMGGVRFNTINEQRGGGDQESKASNQRLQSLGDADEGEDSDEGMSH